MNEKYNDATRNRPEGARPIDAALIRVDLAAYEQQLKQEEAWHKSDHNAITVYKTEGMSIVLMVMHANTEIPPHNAEGAMSLQMLDGSIRLNSEEKGVDLNKGQIAALHQGLLYSILAIEESTLLLTICHTK
jgi:quercetin dioxygenase-like cupin family protein